jgi:hypothetical protein
MKYRACRTSTQIVSHAHTDPEDFLRNLQDRVWQSRYYSSSLYAASLPYNVRPGTVRRIFESMVDLSDNGNILDRFLALPFPQMYPNAPEMWSRIAEFVERAG